MLNRAAIAAVSLFLFAACEPRMEEPALDGAPAAESAPGALDGGGPLGAETALPVAMGIVLPTGVQSIDNCERVIAADYTNPPKMTCLLLQTEDHEAGKLDAGVFVAISDAGWSFVRAQGDQHYFERPQPGTDCAETTVISVVSDRLQAVVDHAAGGKPADGALWEAYAIPASTREACGADRMRP